MATISRYVTEFVASMDGFIAPIKQAQRDAKELNDRLKPVKEVASTMGTAMATVGGTVTTAIGAMAKQAANYGDAIRDMSIRTGATTQQLSALKVAAEQNGTSLEAVGTGLKFLAKNAVEAASGAKEQAAMFRALGLSVTDVSGNIKPANELFVETADRISRMKDGAEKTSVMLKLFGKSGVELTEVMNLGKAGLAAASDEAARFGLVVGAVAAKQADEFNDALHDISLATTGMSMTVSQQFIPILTSAARTVTEAIVQIREWTGEHPSLTKGIGMTAAALTGAGGLLLGLTAVLAILPQLTKALDMLKGSLSLSTVAFMAVAAAVIYFRREIAVGLVAALATVVQGFEKLLDWGQKVAVVIGNQGLVNKFQSAKDSTNAFRQSLDDFVVAGLTDISTIEKTSKQLESEAATRLKAAMQTEEHTTSLRRNTQAAEEALETIKDITTRNHSQLANALDDLRKANDYKLVLDSKAFSEALEHKIKLFDSVKEILVRNRADLETHLEQAAGDNKKWIAVMSHDYSDALAKRIKDADDAAKRIKEAQEKAVADVRRSAGAIFDDMFQRGESVFASLRNLLKGGTLSLGRAIFEDIVGALFGPIKAAFDSFFKGLLEGSGFKGFISGLGQQIGKALGGLFGGGGSGGISGLDLKKMGGGLLGLLGIGGGGAAGGLSLAAVGTSPLFAIPGLAAAAPAIPAISVAGGASTAAGGGAAGAGGFGGTMSAFLTNPWTIGIGAAIGIATAWIKSQAHHEATTFVKTFQDPFANDKGTGALNKIIDAFNAANAAAQLTSDAAIEARRQVVALWDSFKQQANQFASKGSDEFTVVQQAFSTMTKHFGQDLSGLLGDMDGVINNIQPVIARAIQTVSDTVDNFARQTMVTMETLGIALQGGLQTDTGGTLGLDPRQMLDVMASGLHDLINVETGEVLRGRLQVTTSSPGRPTLAPSRFQTSEPIGPGFRRQLDPVLASGETVHRPIETRQGAQQSNPVAVTINIMPNGGMMIADDGGINKLTLELKKAIEERGVPWLTSR